MRRAPETIMQKWNEMRNWMSQLDVGNGRDWQHLSVKKRGKRQRRERKSCQRKQLQETGMKWETQDLAKLVTKFSPSTGALLGPGVLYGRMLLVPLKGVNKTLKCAWLLLCRLQGGSTDLFFNLGFIKESSSEKFPLREREGTGIKLCKDFRIFYVGPRSTTVF